LYRPLTSLGYGNSVIWVATLTRFGYGNPVIWVATLTRFGYGNPVIWVATVVEGAFRAENEKTCGDFLPGW
jgi:hypothetical protein